MPLSTRKIIIALRQQTPAVVTVEFYPQLTGSDGELLLEKKYAVTTAANGTGEIILPVKTSGAIRYDYRIPKSETGDDFSYGYFYLFAGTDINLSELIIAGTAISDNSLQNYVDQKLAAHVAEANPHSIYERVSQKNIANGYVGLDNLGKINANQLPLSNTITAVVTADQNFINQNILQNTELTQLVEAGKTYLLRASLFIGWTHAPGMEGNSAGNGGIKIGYGGIISPLDLKIMGSYKRLGSATGTPDFWHTAFSDVLAFNFTNAAQFFVHLSGTIKPSTEGFFYITACQQNANSQPTTIYAGSNMFLIRQ